MVTNQGLGIASVVVARHVPVRHRRHGKVLDLFASLALAQIVIDPASPVPMVGASGAIGGVMGAYVVLYPRVPVHLLVVLGFIVTTFTVPAYLMLGYWFVLQLLGGLPQLGGSQRSGGWIRACVKHVPSIHTGQIRT